MGLSLPAVLIQRGLKLACETKDTLKETVRTNLHVAVGSVGKWAQVPGQAVKTAVLKVGRRRFVRDSTECQTEGRSVTVEMFRSQWRSTFYWFLTS